MRKNQNPVMEVINGIAGIYLCFGIGAGIAFAISLMGGGMDYISPNSLLYSFIVIMISLALQLFFRIKVETMFVLQTFLLPIFVMLSGLGLVKNIININMDNIDKNSPIFIMQEALRFEVLPLFLYFFSTIYLLIILYGCFESKKEAAGDLK